MLDGSEPAAGSVSPKLPITSPRAIGGSHSCFCSSLPHRWIEPIASEPCTETNVRMPESPASSSSAARPYSTALRPGHPYPSRFMPSTPELAEGGRELGREIRPVEPVGDVRADLCVDERAHAVTYRSLGVAQQRVDREDIGCLTQRLDVVRVPGVHGDLLVDPILPGVRPVRRRCRDQHIRRARGDLSEHRFVSLQDEHGMRDAPDAARR